MILSIVIVNWNTRTLLFNLLASLYEHPPCGDFEVIMVDNASTDSSREMVTAEFPSVKLLVNPYNMGFARAVNCGIRESCGHYVLLLNTDVTVLDGSIDSQIAFMETNPNTAFCGGALLNDQRIPKWAYGGYPTATNLFAEILPYRMGARNRIVVEFSTEQTQAIPVEILSGATLMARRTAFESIGLFDEQFFMYFEDADWCYRARRLGWDVCYVPSVHYTHIGIASAISFSSFRKQWITSLGLFIHKHYHGVQFVTCWLLWQLLRVKFAWWMVRMRVKNRLSLKVES